MQNTLTNAFYLEFLMEAVNRGLTMLFSGDLKSFWGLLIMRGCSAAIQDDSTRRLNVPPQQSLSKKLTDEHCILLTFNIICGSVPAFLCNTKTRTPTCRYSFSALLIRAVQDTRRNLSSGCTGFRD